MRLYFQSKCILVSLAVLLSCSVAFAGSDDAAAADSADSDSKEGASPTLDTLSQEQLNKLLMEACQTKRMKSRDKQVQMENARWEVASVREQIEAGADIDYRDPDTGRTCLVVAAAEGKAAVCRYLLRNGADPYAADDEGMTPTFASAKWGRWGVMKQLVEIAEVDVLNQFHEEMGWYTLHFACKAYVNLNAGAWAGSGNEHNTKVVEYLLEIGEDPRRKTRDGETCKDLTESYDTLGAINSRIREMEEAEKAEKDKAGEETSAAATGEEL